MKSFSSPLPIRVITIYNINIVQNYNGIYDTPAVNLDFESGKENANTIFNIMIYNKKED